MAADVTLRDGRALEVDLYRVKRWEWVKFVKGELSEAEDNALIGRAVGLTAEEAADLPMPDYRAVVAALVKKSREPLADPNSPSGSS